jgi:hypothetical protein
VTYAFDATSTTMTDKMTRRTKERSTRRPARRNALVLARRTASGAGTTRYLDDKSQ